MKGILALLMAGIMMAAMIAPAMGGDADTSATVGFVNPVVVSVAVTPDPVTMNPCPATTPITVTAEVCDANGVADITGVSVTIPGIGGPVAMAQTVVHDATCATYEVVINLDCCTAADSYTATVTATDANAGTGTNWDIFVIDTLTAIGITPMDFAAGVPGDCVAGTHTVTNLGNGGVQFRNLQAAAADAVCPDCYPLDQFAWDGYDDSGVADDEIMWTNMIGDAALNFDIIEDDMMRIVNVGIAGDPEPLKDPHICLACNGVLDVDFKLCLPNVNSDTYRGTTTFTPNPC